MPFHPLRCSCSHPLLPRFAVLLALLPPCTSFIFFAFHTPRLSRGSALLCLSSPFLASCLLPPTRLFFSVRCWDAGRSPRPTTGQKYNAAKPQPRPQCPDQASDRGLRGDGISTALCQYSQHPGGSGVWVTDEESLSPHAKPHLQYGRTAPHNTTQCIQLEVTTGASLSLSPLSPFPPLSSG